MVVAAVSWRVRELKVDWTLSPLIGAGLTNLLYIAACSPFSMGYYTVNMTFVTN